MSNIKPDDFRKHAAEEDFFRLAAMEIESEQNEEFLEAQRLPDPSPEVLQRMQANLQMTMRRTRKRKRRHTIFLHLGRFTACAAVVCCILISGVYFNVDAARNSINNFVLELFDDHAVIRTESSEISTGALLPMNWSGPYSSNWTPAKFSSVQVTSLNFNWILKYSNKDCTEGMSIYVWVASHAPQIDIEESSLLEKVKIQGSDATIYTKKGKEICTLLWAKNDYIVMISGNICSEDAKKIAENIVF